MPWTFVALAPPAEQRSALAAYIERCRELGPGFRWVAPEGVHVTLRFLGKVADPVLDAIRARLRGVRHQPFALGLDGLGTFGARRPSVIWLGITTGLQPVAALAGAVEAECVAAGLAPEARPFRPHLTLARARERAGAPLPELPPPPELAPWIADQMVLYESRPTGKGPPVYVPIEVFGLKPDRP